MSDLSPFLSSCSTALAYGLVCLAMAYIASIMGSVLQVTKLTEELMVNVNMETSFTGGLLL